MRAILITLVVASSTVAVAQPKPKAACDPVAIAQSKGGATIFQFSKVTGVGASSNPTTSQFEMSGLAATERTEDGCKAPEGQTKVTLIFVEAAPARMHVIMQACLALGTAAQTSGQRFSLKVSGSSDIVVKAAPGDRVFAWKPTLHFGCNVTPP
jgi:hypothetical protein